MAAPQQAGRRCDGGHGEVTVRRARLHLAAASSVIDCAATAITRARELAGEHDTIAQLRQRNVTVHELEIPHGPCATFTIGMGQRYAVYQLTRPGAIRQFDGRIDP